MRRLPLVVVLAAVLWLPGAATASSPPRPARFVAVHRAPERVAFRSHFRFGRSRGRSYGFGANRRRTRHGILRRAVKTAIWLYILHLFFSHGALSILLWIVIIGLVVSLMRRRRRRYAY